VVVCDRPEARALDRARAFDPPVPAVLVDPGRPVDRDALDRAIVAVLREHQVDLVCLAGYMRLVGPRILGAFPNRVLNIHPALLPAFPGLHAQRQALEHGVRIAGCTVHVVDEGVDTGPIVAQAAVPVYDGDDEESLRLRILRQEHRLYPAAIRLACTTTLTRSGRRLLRSPAAALPSAPPALQSPDDVDALL
jgi:phosphoribosylglycinamide formyltransferase-1